MNNIDRIYFLLPNDHALATDLVAFDEKRQAIHDSWQTFADDNGAYGICAGSNVVGLAFKDEHLPNGWVRNETLPEGAYAPDIETEKGKELNKRMLSLAPMLGGKEFSELVLEHFELEGAIEGGFPDRGNQSGTGFMAHYLGYEILAGVVLISVPVLDLAPNEIGELKQLKNSEYWTYVEAAQEVVKNAANDTKLEVDNERQ